MKRTLKMLLLPALLLAILALSPTQSATAQTFTESFNPWLKTNNDSINITGTSAISFSLLTNDFGRSKTIQQYCLKGVKYNPITTNKILTGMGTLKLKADGTGTFTPLSTYHGGDTIYILITNTKGWATSRFVFRNTTIPDPDPDPEPDPGLANFQYELTAQSTTSAGAYRNSDGALLRTLWSGVTKPAGINTITGWDGKDDAGANISVPYTLKVLSNQMTYTWQASIGNSSTVATGSSKIRGLRTPWDAVVVGNYIYMCTGFTEGNTPHFKVNISSPGTMTPILPSDCGDVSWEIRKTCSDGTLIYWGGFDAWDGFWPAGNTRAQNGEDYNSRCAGSVIYATTVSGDAKHTFSSGSVVKPSYTACSNFSAIDTSYQVINQITGLAVQTSGNYLYSAHQASAKVKCFNKTTGALVQTITSMPLGSIAIEGTTLWGTDGTTVKKYTINSNGTLTYASVTLNFSEPIAVTARDGLILVVDRGTQQVKAYNASGSLQWTYGQANGYVNSPTAAFNKFSFTDFNDNVAKGFVTLAADGSFWIGDAGDCRTLQVSSARTHLQAISYLPMNYNGGVDKNDPNRVFAGFLEFNATTGLLAANWSGNLTTNYRIGNQKLRIFYNVVTLSGKTFGTIHYYADAPADDSREPEVVELTSTGLRFTGIRWDQNANDIIETNGDRYYYVGDAFAPLNSGTSSLRRRPYTGLNGSGNPTWGTEVTVAIFPNNTSNPFYQCNTQPNSMGYIFSDNYANSGYHLGRVSGSQYIWKAAPSTTRQYTGNYPTDKFDIGNGVEYAGRNLYYWDSICTWNYIGEFWKNSQVNKWHIYHKDGLLLMVIGKHSVESTGDAASEAAGNAFGGGMVKVGNTYKIYHGDESHHGAMHCFTVSGGSTMKWHIVTH